VSDADLAPRLEPMLPQIVEILNKLTPQVNYPAYFEFLAEFVKYYAVVL
jgi:ArsR family metal-binding transcriptional regulator